MPASNDAEKQPMRLADFVLANMEPILQAWQDFADTIVPASNNMDPAELRDHAEQMLRTIVKDLRTTQTAKEQIIKSHGTAPRGLSDTAAETHALTRLTSGFTIDQMVSEYRALRASVLSLWSHQASSGDAFELKDITRFNEAIDQALAESIARYSQAVMESHHIFLGILGHDLRTPLSAVSLGAEVLLRSDDLHSRHTKTASRIYASVGRANSIVDSLLDFTRSHLGSGIPIRRAECDLAAICEGMVEEARTCHPEHSIMLELQDTPPGQFDAVRIGQVFANLIGNAVEHGDSTVPIMVSLHAEASELVFAVHNQGAPIEEADLPFIFKPMSRHSHFAAEERGPRSGLGLGLYIAQEIVHAHGGKIDVESKAGDGTQFRVRLPLVAPAALSA